jgi:hypothetical protein
MKHLCNHKCADIEDFLQAPHQLSYPIKAFSPKEVLQEIKLLNPRKAPGHDLIVKDMLKNLPRKTVVLYNSLYNSMLRLGYYPIQWKLAQIIMVAKPGKPPTETNSYRPISLLPIMSKIFERPLLKRFEEAMPLNKLIPNHQFGFRRKCSTIQQCHRLSIKLKLA